MSVNWWSVFVVLAAWLASGVAVVAAINLLGLRFTPARPPTFAIHHPLSDRRLFRIPRHARVAGLAAGFSLSAN